jgi:hypothetical protein
LLRKCKGQGVGISMDSQQLPVVHGKSQILEKGSSNQLISQFI